MVNRKWLKPYLRPFTIYYLPFTDQHSLLSSSTQNCVNLILVQDRVVLAVDGHFVSTVLAEDDSVAGLDAELVSLAVVQDSTRAHGDDLAGLGLLLCGIGKVDATGGLSFLLG